MISPRRCHTAAVRLDPRREGYHRPGGVRLESHPPAAECRLYSSPVKRNSQSACSYPGIPRPECGLNGLLLRQKHQMTVGSRRIPELSLENSSKITPLKLSFREDRVLIYQEPKN